MRTLIVAALTLIMVVPVAADPPPAAPDALKPLASLVGPVWKAVFPDGKTTDEQEYTWVYGGLFLRNVHYVKNADGEVVYEGEAIFAWDSTNETIVWWYWNTTGGFATGTTVPTDDGWLSEGSNHAPPPQPSAVRGLIRNVTPEGYEAVQYFRKEGAWEEQFTTVYRPVARD